MVRISARLLALLVLAATACSSKPPATSGVGALKMKDPVWATYAWSRGRMAYVIYFVPNSSAGFNPDGVAAIPKYTKEGDTFEGGLDGYTEKSKCPFRADPKKGELAIENKSYRGCSVFLVTVGTPTKVQLMNGIAFNPSPKDPEEWPAFAESEVRRLAKEDPKIAAFPKEPAPPDPKAKKK